MELNNIVQCIKDGNEEFCDTHFENVSIEDIENERIAFFNCKFKNVKFDRNKLESIEFEKCEFEDCTFSGILNNIFLYINECIFARCNFEHLNITGYDEQSEILESKFYECSISDSVIKADISISGGSWENIKVSNIDAKMNIIFEVNFISCIFSKIMIDVAVKRSVFRKCNEFDVSFSGVNEENKVEK